jgi:hypothetical protein
MSSLPNAVIITDDTMREGLQIESAAIPVDAKLRLLAQSRRHHNKGCRYFCI